MRTLTDLRFLAALALLVVNDHVLKGAFEGEWPGLLTGKLSDVVGPIVAAVLLASSIRLVGGSVGSSSSPIARRGIMSAPRGIISALIPLNALSDRAVGISIVVVAALMTAINTSAAAAGAVGSALAITGWTQSMVVDPTDLFGLVGLALVPRIVTDPKPLTESPVAKALALGAGAAACMASSAIPNPAYDSVATDGGDVVVVVDSGDDQVGHLRSIDGGSSWDYVSNPTALTLPGPLQFATTQCLTRDPSVCVRTAEGLTIEESNDGGSSWREVYSVEMGGHLAPFTNAEFAEVWQEASAVAELADGSVVVVMGQLEPAVRSPDGAWSPDAGRYRTPGVGAMISIVFGSAIAAAGAALIGLHRKGVGIIVLVTTVPLLGLAWTLWFVNDTVGLLVLPFGLGSFIAVVVSAVAFVATVLARNRRRPIEPSAMVAVIAGPVLIGLVALAPLLAWRLDLTRSVSTAWLVLSIAVLGSVATGIVTRRLGGPPPGPPPPRIPPSPTQPAFQPTPPGFG